MNRPPVSLIIPVFNSASYLETCVKSAVASCDLADEILLGNDGSTDSSALICQELALVP